jgi:rhodanese-related sulfurtransferase
MIRSAFLTSLLSLVILPHALAQEKVKHVNAEEAAKLVQEGKVTVLDVRTEDEFKEGHIKGAKNVDFNAEDFAKKAAQVDKSKPVLVHCQAGGRSTKSLPTLEKLGFEIYHLDGGFSAWEDAGKPVEK